MSTSTQRAMVWSPVDHPYLEIIDAPPLAYNSTFHLHEDMEVSWKSKGTWNLFVRGENHLITPDMLVITPPEEPHTASSAQIVEGQFIGLRFQTEFLREIIAENAMVDKWSLFHSSASFINDSAFRTQIYRLHRGLMQNNLPRLEQDVLIQQIVARILRPSKYLPQLSNYARESHIIEIVKAYIHDHYQEAVSLQQLAQLANMSAFHLNRIFALKVGIPPHAYQLQIRISRSKRLLAQGRPIAEVALQTGFTSQSHFGIYFKRIVSITPGQYTADVQHGLKQTAII